LLLDGLLLWAVGLHVPPFPNWPAISAATLGFIRAAFCGHMKKEQKQMRHRLKRSQTHTIAKYPFFARVTVVSHSIGTKTPEKNKVFVS
jgi:hypothetical protein